MIVNELHEAWHTRAGGWTKRRKDRDDKGAIDSFAFDTLIVRYFDGRGFRRKLSDFQDSYCGGQVDMSKQALRLVCFWWTALDTFWSEILISWQGTCTFWGPDAYLQAAQSLCWLAESEILRYFTPLTPSCLHFCASVVGLLGTLSHFLRPNPGYIVILYQYGMFWWFLSRPSMGWSEVKHGSGDIFCFYWADSRRAPTWLSLAWILG